MFLVLTRSHDKGAQNWEIEESSQGVRICPLFDNEVTFYDEDQTTILKTDPTVWLTRQLLISSLFNESLYFDIFDTSLQKEDYICIAKNQKRV